MKALALAALAAAVLVSPVTTGAASAAPDPTGTLCGFAVQDLEVQERFTGMVVGGPLVFPDGTDAHPGTLVCTIQTGTNDTHPEADAAVTTGTGFGSSVVTGTVTYDAPEDLDQYICSHVDFGWASPTLYWDAVVRGWSTDASVACSLAISVATPDPRPVSGGHDDYVYCPLWSVVFPPEGNIELPVVGMVWDCPPYDDDAELRYRLYGIHLVTFAQPEATEPR